MGNKTWWKTSNQLAVAVSRCLPPSRRFAGLLLFLPLTLVGGLSDALRLAARFREGIS
jgi:hypothetical protein